jgi:hypothetical protein
MIWQGLPQLIAELRNLPGHLGDEAADRIEDAVEHTASSLRQVYPIGDTGKLRAGIRTQMSRSAFGASGTVVSASRHAHLWEFGTQDRETAKGWKRGKMPSEHRSGLAVIAPRWRRRMYQELAEILRREGFVVSGSV